MATYTEKLNLKKPAPEEFYNIEGFNDNFQKIDDFARDIDENLSATKIATGSYVGTGTAGKANPSSLTFGFAPKYLLIRGDGGHFENGKFEIIRGVTTDTPVFEYMFSDMGSWYLAPYSGVNYITWKDNGIEWYHEDPLDTTQMNEQGVTYHYLAIG